MTIALCVLLIALTPLPWWAVVVVRRALGRRPAADRQIREQSNRFAITGLAGFAVTVIAVNYLLGLIGLPQLPRGAGFVLLAAVLLLIYAPPAWFLLDHYRRP